MSYGVLSLIALTPIVIIFCLFVFSKIPTHLVSVLGWLLVLLCAILFFNTSLKVGLMSTLAGLVQSFPVTLMTLFATLQVCLMESTGAIKRISVFFKTLSVGNKTAQVMTMNVGAGVGLVTVGAFPNVVLPRIMQKMGYSNRDCIALPNMGFDPLALFGLLCAPLVVFADMTGSTLLDVAKACALFMPVITTGICFSMLYYMGGWKMIKEGFVPCLIAGVVCGSTPALIAYVPIFQGIIVLTGIMASILTIAALLIYVKVKGLNIIDKSHLTDEDREIEQSMSIWAAFSPWIILVCGLLLANLIPPISKWLFVAMAMPVEIIPGQVIKTRMLWNAYTFTLVSSIIACIWLKPNSKQIQETLKVGLRRAYYPVTTLAAFFAVGFVMNYSGMVSSGDTWKITEITNNMTTVLAMTSADVFGKAYALFTAPLGVFGGFVGSTVTSAVAMFSKYIMLTSEQLGINPLLMMASVGIGGGLASMISPGKLQCSSSILDSLGAEKTVAKELIPILIILTAITGLMCFIIS
ncbi:MAG: L-lactate permease [Dehalobacterium sp.]